VVVEKGMHQHTRPSPSWLLVALVAMLSLAACGSSDEPVASGVESTTTAPVDPDTPVSNVPGTDIPDDAPTDPLAGSDVLDPAVAEELVGLTVAEARTKAVGFGWTVRVVREDGVDLAVTEDYSMSRVNVEVADSEIIRIINFG